MPFHLSYFHFAHIILIILASGSLTSLSSADPGPPSAHTNTRTANAQEEVIPHSQPTRCRAFPYRLGQSTGRSYLTVKPRGAGSPTYAKILHGKILLHNEATRRWLFPHTLGIWTAHGKTLLHSQTTRRWLFFIIR